MLRDAINLFLAQYEKVEGVLSVPVCWFCEENDWKGLGVVFREYADKFGEEEDGIDLFLLVKSCLVVLNNDILGTIELLSDILDMVERKNNDYGSAVFHAPCCAPCLSIGSAILVRLSDKFERFWNLVGGNQNQVKESIEDTVKDIVGYVFLLWYSEGNLNADR